MPSRDKLQTQIQVAMNKLEKRHFHYGEPRDWAAYWQDRDTTVASLIDQQNAAKVEANKSYCGCPMCEHHSSAYTISHPDRGAQLSTKPLEREQ